MKKCLLYYFVLNVFILVPCLNVQAQFPNHTQTNHYLNANAFWAWYIGNGLDWSNGSPTYVPTAFPVVVTGEHGLGVAAVSDPQSGDLRFYTNGHKVWDKYHSIMPNGADLLGNSNGRTSQGACIIPMPDDSDKYYVFSHGGVDSDSAGLYYSVVDMSVNSGNGDVLPSQKNIPVDTNTVFTNGMVAVPGNNCNVWLLVHEFKDLSEGGSNNYYAYEISQTGVNSMPVISQGNCDTVGYRGILSVSPDRKKLALIDQDAGFAKFNWNTTTSELSKFDPNTGLVSDAVPIVPTVVWDTINPANIKLNTYYEAEFSPNSNVLYVIESNSTMLFGSFFTVSQMDVSVWDSTAVNSSLIPIDTFPSTVLDEGTLRSYSDSIYVLVGNSNKIGRIAQPNLLGAACDLDWDVISLPLPNKTFQIANISDNVVYPTSNSMSTVLDTGICEAYTLHAVGAEQNADYVWNNGSTDSFLVVQEPGTYWVAYSYFKDNCWYTHVDTFKITTGSVGIPAEITINVNTLGTTASYATYRWLKDGVLISGATDSTYEVTENGDYQVIVSDEAGCIDTSKIYTVMTAGLRSLENHRNIRLYPNPITEYLIIEIEGEIFYNIYHIDGRLVEKHSRKKRIDMSKFSNGMYQLNIYDVSGLRLHSERIIKLSE